MQICRLWFAVTRRWRGRRGGSAVPARLGSVRLGSARLGPSGRLAAGALLAGRVPISPAAA
jgi:hypothetical protein